MSEPLELWEVVGVLPGKWADDALCKEADPDLFHAEKGQGGRIAAGKRVCGACPVVDQCLEWALENREPHGLFGGVYWPERNKILRARDKAEAKLRAAEAKAVAVKC